MIFLKTILNSLREHKAMLSFILLFFKIDILLAFGWSDENGNLQTLMLNISELQNKKIIWIYYRFCFGWEGFRGFIPINLIFGQQRKLRHIAYFYQHFLNFPGWKYLSFWVTRLDRGLIWNDTCNFHNREKQCDSFRFAVWKILL